MDNSYLHNTEGSILSELKFLGEGRDSHCTSNSKSENKDRTHKIAYRKRIIVERDRMYERNGCDGKKWWLTLKPLDSTYEHEENANLG